MSENETRVTYKAVADWTSFNRAVDRAKKKLAELKAEEAAVNSSSVDGTKKATEAKAKHVGAISQENQALEALAKGLDRAQAATGRHNNELRGNVAATNAATMAQNTLASAVDKGSKSLSNATAANKALKEATLETRNVNGGVEQSWKKLSNGVEVTVTSFKKTRSVIAGGNRELSGFQRYASQAMMGAQRLSKNLDKLRDWRPRLTPPFIALVPVIGAVLALINPLIAGFGAIVPVALGFASSLGSVGAAAIGAVPAIAVLLGTVLSLKTALSGIGGAFKKYGAMKAAGGGGGGGGGGSAVPKLEEITKTERIARANEAYRRSIEDVKFAAEDLDDARVDYIKRLQQLQKAVDRAAQSEARAAANSQLAKENYANTLADPGSTKGQKMDAAAGMSEAETDLQDVREENKQNAADLTEMQRKGINGDRQVIASQRALTDALNSQRDAQIAVANSYKDTADAAAGGGGGAAGAADAFQEALNKLSPSARRFVLELIDMQDEFESMKRTVQEAFFSKFIDNLQLLRRLFPPVTSMMSDLAGAAGNVTSRFLEMVTSDAWLSDITQFGKEAAPVLEDVGDGFLYVLDGLRELTLAAMPFLASMSGRFKQSMEDFRDLLSSARADGSLASYLEKVEGRLLQWWQIIKNVGATLFNYSAAASDFGQWLTDGLEELTESWVKNSEEARKEGSGFQDYLENLKPLLVEVKGLFGDFFGFLKDEGTDPENIKSFTKLIKMIREDLGPNLKRILDALSDAKIQEGLVEAVSSLLGAIATFLENGGAEGLKNFFDVLTDVFNTINDIIEVIPDPVIEGFVTAMAGLAALTFLGLNALLGSLITLAGKTGLKGIFGALGKALGKIPKGGLKIPKGGLLGVAAGIVTGVAADNIRENNDGPSGDSGSGARVGANALEGAGTGAAIGATIGSVVPVVGTAAGAGVGAAVGAGVGVLSSNQDDIDAFDKSVNESLSNLFTVTIPNLWNGFVSWVNGWADPINEAVNGWLADGGKVIADFFTVTIPGWYNGMVTSVNEWADPINEKVNTWLADKGQGISDFFTITIPGWYTTFTTWVNGWADPINTKVNTWLKDRGKGISDFFFVTVPGWWSSFVGWVNGWSNPINDRVNTWGRGVGQGVHDFFFVTVPGWWSSFKSWVNGWSNPINDKVNGWISSAQKKVSDWVGNIGGGGGKGKYNGGPILRRAGGGGVPGTRSNSDTVPAMLTPGEFVVRKAVVNRIGMENLTKLNAGVMSYADMLRQQAQNTPGQARGQDTSFLAGGGLVPVLSGSSQSAMAPSSSAPQAGAFTNDYSMHFGDVIINNPVPEQATQSLPRALRNLGYLGSVRNK